MSLALRERARRVERIEAAVLDALCEGVLIAVDGRVKLLNRAAAKASPAWARKSSRRRSIAGGRAADPRSSRSICAAIPRDLLESELFGYEAGAFTGANPRGHAGKFELAQGGTLLLDDVIDLPLEMQAKLLRVLQERSVTRLGASRSRPVDVRIVATSNVPLREAVESGRFRSDLFYRLSVLSIAVPPLRDRRQDIRPLAERFLCKYSAAHGRAPLAGRRRAARPGVVLLAGKRP